MHNHSMRTVAIDRIAVDSAEAVERLRAGVPFVFRVHWTAHEAWSVEYFKTRVVPKQVRIYRKLANGELEQTWIDIRELFAIVGKPGFGDNYDIGALFDSRLWEAGAPDPHLGRLL